MLDVLAGSFKAPTDRLQRVLNAVARVVSGTHKFDRGLTHLLHSELHWLDVPQRIQCIRARSALEALRNALHKCSTYLLTYLLSSYLLRQSA